MMAAEPLQRITATDFFFIKTFRSSGSTLLISSVVSLKLSLLSAVFLSAVYLSAISFVICLFYYLSEV